MYAHGSKWQAQTTYAGKKHKLGSFCTKEEAAAAYDTAAEQHQSEYSGVVYNFESAEAGDAAAAMPTPRLETTAQRPRPMTKSGYYGVYANGSKWQAQIHYTGKTHSLGTFRTKEEAAAAYDTAARQHKSGESGAVFNFESAEAGDAAAVTSTQGLETTAQRTKTRPKSGYYGVTAKGSKWKTQITYAGKNHYLGTFRTKEEAAAAYDTAARQFKSGESGVVYNFESAEAGDAALAMATRLPETTERTKTRPKLGGTMV